MPVDRARDYDVGMSPDFGRPEERPFLFNSPLEDDWPDPEPPLDICEECGVFFYGLQHACSLCPNCLSVQSLDRPEEASILVEPRPATPLSRAMDKLVRDAFSG